MQKNNNILILLTMFCIFSTFLSTPKYCCTYAQKQVDGFEAMVTMEVSSERILYSKNANKKLPMASTTKILTAIIAIEQGGDLDKFYEIPKEAVGIEGSSIYLRQGEHLTLRELLYGLMLRSGNDSAVAIAIVVAGSVEKFVKLMNEYAEKLNLSNSHFVTVNGLHDDDHYTCAYDLAKITSYALSNKTFADIVSTKEKVISNEFDTKYKCRLLKNKNKLLSMIDGADGVKTGYTRKAGKCFVGSATRAGMKIVCVVLNSQTMFEEAAKYLELSFKNFNMKKVFDKDTNLIKNCKNSSIYIKNDIILPLSADEFTSLKAKIEFDNEIKLISGAETKVGKLNIYKQNDLIFSEDIFTINNMDDDAGFKDYFGKIVQIF